MPPYEKEEPNKGEVWVPKKPPTIAQVLQKRIFEGETEFPVNTVVAYKYSRFMVGVEMVIARFNGETWEITGDQEPRSTPYFLDMLRGPSVSKIWLLEEGATIYRRDEKDKF